jgi:GDP-L-fucose synthase
MIQAKQLGFETFDVWGTGAPVRSWLYAPQFAENIIKIFDEEKIWEHKILNFPPTVRDISIKQLALRIAKEVKYEGFINFDSSKADGDPVKILISDKLEMLLKPKQYEFSEAIRETVFYFENNI